MEFLAELQVSHRYLSETNAVVLYKDVRNSHRPQVLTAPEWRFYLHFRELICADTDRMIQF